MTEPYRGIFAIQYSTFREDGVFDESDFESQVEFTVGAGAHGIVWPVMVSEFTVLTEKERRRSTELLLKRVAGRLPVVIGVATVWTELSAPDPLEAGDVYAWFKVWGSSASDVYIVGQKGAVLHWDDCGPE